MVNINLSTRGAAIHRPRIDDYPVYCRVDNDIQEISKRSDKWQKNVENIYNSPTNIRRVYFTYKSVYVEHFQPVVGCGNTLKAGIKGSNIKEIVIKNAYNKDHKFSGSYLTAITTPWVCSNIEEIYFDWSIFTSNDILNLGFGNLLRDSLASFTGEVKGISLQVIQLLFARYCMNSNTIEINAIKERFPRLKVVGYIRDLDNIYNNTSNKSGRKGIDDFILPWCVGIDSIKASMEQKTSTLWLLPDANKFISKSIIRDNTYKFDRNVLLEYFNNLNKAYNQRIEKDRQAEQLENNLTQDKDKLEKEKLIHSSIEQKQESEKVIQEIKEFEGMLSNIINNYGTKVGKDALYIALRKTSDDNKGILYRGLSTEFKQLYEDAFHIGGGD